MQQSNDGVIGVLMGGCSSERDISLKSGAAVSLALRDAGCKVVDLDITDPSEISIRDQLLRSKIDVAFIALHGRLGEDGTIQMILEQLEIPYVGSGPEASRRAFDKSLTQELLRSRHIPVADFAIIKKSEPNLVPKIKKLFRTFPIVVKPACEGSSIGVSIVKEESEILPALEDAFAFGPTIIVEKFIKGRELTVGILRESPLPIVEVIPKRPFFDYTAKYQKGNSEYRVPAALDVSESELIQATALHAYRALGCRDFARVDVILDESGTPYVLEVNTIPGFTSQSLLPKAAAVAGISFKDLCLTLIELAYGKIKKDKNIARHC